MNYKDRPWPHTPWGLHEIDHQSSGVSIYEGERSTALRTGTQSWGRGHQGRLPEGGAGQLRPEG